VYHKVQELLKEGIFIKFVIGNTHLCQINLQNDKAVNLLVLNEILRRDIFLKQNEKYRGIVQLLKILKATYAVRAAFYLDKTCYIVCDNLAQVPYIEEKLEKTSSKCISTEEFLDIMLKPSAITENVILVGFEQYFELLQRIPSQLQRRLSPEKP
jgi:hypothetical protein